MNDFDKLLKALREGKRDLIGRLACDLFITKEGEHNRAEINAFEKYAPCTITPVTINRYGSSMVCGKIYYNEEEYVYG
jgi:hypothetical protein